MESRNIEYLYYEILKLPSEVELITIIKKEIGENLTSNSNNLEDIFDNNKIIKINNNNEVYVNLSPKNFLGFLIFPKPLEVKRILIPEKIENENVKLSELSRESYTVVGIRFPNSIPFILLETNEGNKIISKEDIYVIPSKKVDKEDVKKKKGRKKSKKRKKSKAKKSTRRQTAKGESSRKS